MLEKSNVSEKGNVFNLDKLVFTVKKAQNKYAGFTQEQVDKIVINASMAANNARILLAKEAVAETGRGIVEDKVIKNHFASEFVYNKYRNVKTCGVVYHDAENGIRRLATPVGVIAGIVPVTNPTSTAIFKALLALKTRNGIIFSPHPNAKKCTIQALQIMLEAAVKAGAPENIIGWIDEPSIDLSQGLMQHRDINLILATGGPAMVKAAYSSGTPAIGVGPGNVPSVVDETADVEMAIHSILHSKSFDNGMVCASEQSVFVVDAIYDQFKKGLASSGAYILNTEEKRKVGDVVIIDKRLNPDVVGKSAHVIASMAKVKVPESTKILVGEAKKVGFTEPFSYEKLSPVLGLYKAGSFKEAVAGSKRILEFGGMGHSASLYTAPENQDRIEYFSKELVASRLMINMPASQGAIGDIYNFRLDPSLTLGCGTYGNNIVSENIGAKHLLNIQTVVERRENMLWIKLPHSTYFKRSCVSEALKDIDGRKKAFIVTDEVLFDLGYVDKVTAILNDMKISYQVFSQVKPDPDLSTIRKGLEIAKSFKPDVIISLGGGSPIDAGKILWLLYEHPESSFEDLTLRFMDIRKRICQFPKLGGKAIFVAIPTTSGTGSEDTPFAVITDDATGIKYPIADYAITPTIAIIDPDFVMNMPKNLTAASGYDAVSHGVEALVAVTATEFTEPMAIEALQLLFKYLPKSYKEGNKNAEAREKVHYAATIAGMSFANAFLGINHSMAHKLGTAFHIPHGIANAILLPLVVKFNATDVPRKMGTFSQYRTPKAVERYAKLADALNLGGKTAKEKVNKLINALTKLRRDLEIPPTIQAFGVPEDEFYAKLDEMSEMAFDDQCTGTNPRYPSIEEIRQLYIMAYS